MNRRRAALLGGLAAGWLLLLAPAASAHPLGNFTVNTADRVVIDRDAVRVQHIVDNAEIPTLQIVQGAGGPDTDGDGRLAEPELASWAAARCAALAPQVVLAIDGKRAPLAVSAAGARTVAGQAGLATLRLECTFDAGRPASDRISLEDPTSAGRTGWKEISATALCGRLTDTGGLPQESPSKLLTAYPADLLTSPVDVTKAAFGVSGGAACRTDSAVPAPSQVLPRGVDRITSSYTSFVGRQDLTWPLALVAVLLSVALGCGHAVAPGHGKTVIAAYLVGQRGTRRQAVWLGATVTATHTAGVLLLGALLSLTSIASPERFVPATEVASGVLLGAVGVYLLRLALRGRRAAAGGHDHGQAHDHEQPHQHPHPHDHDEAHDHPHPHPHDHDHDEAHDHAHPNDHDHDHDPAHDRIEPGGLASGGVTIVKEAPALTRTAPAVHTHGGRTHSHAPIEAGPIGWRTLATMGVAGGLVPSPSALVVLLGASALGRPVFGAVLVLGYGVGMAITLTVAGLLLLRAQAALARRGWTSGRGARTLRLLPAVTAVIVLVVGATVVLRGIVTFRGLG